MVVGPNPDKGLVLVPSSLMDEVGSVLEVRLSLHCNSIYPLSLAPHC
jgi:hypothetical protein